VWVLELDQKEGSVIERVKMESDQGSDQELDYVSVEESVQELYLVKWAGMKWLAML